MNTISPQNADCCSLFFSTLMYTTLDHNLTFDGPAKAPQLLHNGQGAGLNRDAMADHLQWSERGAAGSKHADIVLINIILENHQKSQQIALRWANSILFHD